MKFSRNVLSLPEERAPGAWENWTKGPLAKNRVHSRRTFAGEARTRSTSDNLDVKWAAIELATRPGVYPFDRDLG